MTVSPNSRTSSITPETGVTYGHSRSGRRGCLQPTIYGYDVTVRIRPHPYVVGVHISRRLKVGGSTTTEHVLAFFGELLDLTETVAMCKIGW